MTIDVKTNFHNLRVVAFESRRADEMAKLIAHFGGVPLVAPSMREVPLDDNPHAFAFAERLFAGEIDVVILLTGVGTRTLTQAIATKHAREQFIDALKQTTIVARGPKPVAALRELGLAPTLTVPEPNTWRDILAEIDKELPIAGKRVAVQEYGAPNPELIAGLRERGAEVTAVPVYQWALPEDVTPLKNAVREIIGGRVDIALFTSAQQVRNLFAVAKDEGLDAQVRESFQRIVVGSIGPTCNEGIRAAGLSVEHEVDHPKMGDLVRDLARLGAALLQKKRTSLSCGVDTATWRRVDALWEPDAETRRHGDTETTATPHVAPSPGRPVAASSHPSFESPFIKACRREPTDYTPIWLMRQAGRYMREYREFRARHSFIEMCTNPELAAEVTLMAVDRLLPDAAIIFSDLLLILQPMGIDLEYSKGEGPVIHNPIRSGGQVDELREVEPPSLDYVYEAIRITRRALKPTIPLIGFAGLPFTLASYVIEGGGSRNYQQTKMMMYRDPGAWRALMEKLSRAIVGYVKAQIAAGAQAIQLFDSWVGCLSPDDYREYVLPHSKAVFEAVRSSIRDSQSSIPLIHFGTDTATLLELMKQAGGDAIGLDWRVDLADAWNRLNDVAVQGNLDPLVLFAGPREIRLRAQQILDKAGGRPGHIFNLGHGILPGTPVEHVVELIDVVRELSAR